MSLCLSRLDTNNFSNSLIENKKNNHNYRNYVQRPRISDTISINLKKNYDSFMSNFTIKILFNKTIQ